MLEFPPPVLMTYPKEAVVAGKLEDFALLARLYQCDGHLVAEAIRSTFDIVAPQSTQ